MSDDMILKQNQNRLLRLSLEATRDNIEGLRSDGLIDGSSSVNDLLDIIANRILFFKEKEKD